MIPCPVTSQLKEFGSKGSAVYWGEYWVEKSTIKGFDISILSRQTCSSPTLAFNVTPGVPWTVKVYENVSASQTPLVTVSVIW